MKKIVSASCFAVALLFTALGLPALAQEANPSLNSIINPPPPQPGNSDNLSPGPDGPQPLTGELVPLPGPPPEGKAADIKLPDCVPPNCGVPQIMAP
ncbi:hypothetical protein [Ancylobacter amanitiformis]|uniref:Uncharacterized protein n=1 Tax=Ancylobacter amanitiformis TaxID=217069 RepID=A0ABU0LPL2_9HYPH|nr:hypothetical protein [Ancylobacter amanitiformis]MDQ0510538.1 hypothetical protein [Ancylobacter amanitiformis]